MSLILYNIYLPYSNHSSIMKKYVLKKWEIVLIRMLVTYFIFATINKFLSLDSTMLYATIVVFCLISVWLSYGIPKEYRVEQIFVIGISFMLYSTNLAFSLQVGLGSIGLVLLIVSAYKRYVRKNRSMRPL